LKDFSIKTIGKQENFVTTDYTDFLIREMSYVEQITTGFNGLNGYLERFIISSISLIPLLNIISYAIN